MVLQRVRGQTWDEMRGSCFRTSESASCIDNLTGSGLVELVGRIPHLAVEHHDSSTRMSVNRTHLHVI